MALSISAQITEAASVLLAGVALGFLYQFFGVVRQKGRLITALLCDVLFCLIAAAALFLLGMGPGHGQLRLYMPAVAFGGAALYYLVFGAAARPVMLRFLSLLHKALHFALLPLRGLKKIAGIFLIFLKNIFSSVKKWFTIIRNHFCSRSEQMAEGKVALAEETADEIQKNKHIY